MASALERRLHRLEERTQAEQDTLHPTRILITDENGENGFYLYVRGHEPDDEPPTDDEGAT